MPSSTYDNAMAAAGLSPTGGPFDYYSLLPKPTSPTGSTGGMSAADAFASQGTPLGPYDPTLPRTAAPPGQQWFQAPGSNQWSLMGIPDYALPNPNPSQLPGMIGGPSGLSPSGQPYVQPALGGGSLVGAPVGSGYGAYGAVPTVPNPLDSAGQAIGGNLGNLGNLYNLSQGMGSASAAGANQQLIQNLPGYQGNRAQQSSNISELLAGQVPQDVINQIAQQSAAIGAGRGMGPMSPMSNADYLQALGLTSLGLQKEGGTELNQQIATTPQGPQFNPASMLVTPQDQWTAQYLANVLAAAPNPTLAAQQNMASLQAGLGAGRNQWGYPGYPTQGSGAAQLIAPNPAGQRYGQPTYAGVGQVPPDYVQPGMDYNPYADLPGYNVAAPTVPANTYYDPYTDTSNYDYGIPNYYSGMGSGSDMTQEEYDYFYG